MLEFDPNWQSTTFGDVTDLEAEYEGLTGLPYLGSDDEKKLDMRLIRRAALIGGLPVLLGTGAVLLVDRVNPFYRQIRIGRNGEPVIVTKIRTMPHETANVPSAGYNDRRRSKVGKFLSRNRIDEGYQLWNIYKRTMSVIGPRIIHHAEYTRAIEILGRRRAYEWFRARSLALPGAFDRFSILLNTGQLTGDPEADLLTRIELESLYIFETASVEEDLRVYGMGKAVAKEVVRSRLHGARPIISSQETPTSTPSEPK